MNFHTFNFQNKKVIIRVDFNVPLNKNTLEVSDDTRIKAAIPTIQKIINDGGSVILMSHLGRPKNGVEDKYSLKNVLTTLESLLTKKVKFSQDCLQAQSDCEQLQNGEVLLLENLRFYKEEELGDEQFAKTLSSYADFYVNDAFGTAHRAHASTAIIASFFSQESKSFGLLMEAELASANKILNHPESPVCAIIGGAKVSDKILLIENILDKIDTLIIGGGMAYTFIKAQGGEIGKSLCEDDRLQNAIEILKKAKEKNVNVLLPLDSKCSTEFSNDLEIVNFLSAEIPSHHMALDIGEKACQEFANVILQSKTILWNGPMGVFEMSNFAQGTKTIAEAVAKATQNGAYSLIGGGDSVAAINMLGLESQVSYVSTGGGALLELFEGKELPGVKAIEK